MLAQWRSKIALTQRLIFFYRILKTQHQGLIVKSQIWYFFLGLPAFFYFDTPIFNAIMPYGQWINNYCVIWVYLWIYCFANQRLQALMMITLFVGLGMEVFGSVILKLYTYRLKQIPIYVPFGHSIILAISYQIRKQKIVIKHAINLNKLLYTLTFLICVFSFVFLNDVGGTVFYFLFLILLQNREHKLSDLISFLVCTYVELIGTQMHIWAWYGVVGNHPDWVHISNPPCGVGVAYLALHLIASNIYYFFKRRRRLWMASLQFKI